jgi:hypothetical protein
MVELNIMDDLGNTISYLLFRAMYADNSGKRTIQIGCINDLEEVTITPVAIDPSKIPDSMKATSEDCYEYITLSLDDSTFTDTLSISSLSANTNQEIYVECTIPGNINGGSFMCGIRAEGQTT